ncbi:MAG: DUF4142 domain-containing protein [Rariglobus sp.]
MKNRVSTSSLLFLTAFLCVIATGPKLSAQTTSQPAVQTFKESERKPSKSDAYTRSDRRFLVNILRINHNETVIAQLVAERATTREIKALARQLVADLGEANREGRLLAEHKGIPVPESRSESGDLKSWNEKKPENLDQDYLNRARDTLEDLSDLYEKASNKSDDPEIAAFAKKILPSVRKQLEIAGQLVPVHP